jgi:hypothetical protein
MRFAIVLCLAALAAVASNAELAATIRIEGTIAVFSLSNHGIEAVRVLYVLCAVLGWIM